MAKQYDGVVPAVAGVLVSLVLATPARAQLGTGWNAYNPVERIQTRGCATHSANGGVHAFALSCSANAGDNRAEARVENDYSSGTNQFQGEVRVVSLGGSNVSLKQTFMPENGAFLMLAVAAPGRLYSVGDNADLAADIIGRWVRINTIHDVAAGTHEIWIDGVLRFVKRNGRQVPWHDKFGTYRLGSGRGPISAEWRNVQYWRGGRSPGGTPQPPAGDAGAPADGGRTPDAMGDPMPADAGTGGSGGATGGTGGSGGGAGGGSGGTGSGGSGGVGGSGGGGGTGGGGSAGAGGTSSTGSGGSGASGGSGGRGGSAGRTDARGGTGGGSVEGPSKATGCAFAGGHPAQGGLVVTGLVLVLARLGRRGRRC